MEDKGLRKKREAGNNRRKGYVKGGKKKEEREEKSNGQAWGKSVTPCQFFKVVSVQGKRKMDEEKGE